MDDCNGELLQRLDYPQTGSDSSMDDCNPRLRGLRMRLLSGSDSSMDDCNEGGDRDTGGGKRVQIPLWTIVTRLPGCRGCTFSGVQIPLWTIVTLRSRRGWRRYGRSDSSMDDCNRSTHRL